jgi:ribonuclease HI
MQEDAENRHRDLLAMIEALSDATGSDNMSSVCIVQYFSGNQLTVEQISRVYSTSHTR